MANLPQPKIRSNFSFRNVGDALADIFIDAVNQLGNHLNVSIQNGLDEEETVTKMGRENWIINKDYIIHNTPYN